MAEHFWRLYPGLLVAMLGLSACGLMVSDEPHTPVPPSELYQNLQTGMPLDQLVAKTLRHQHIAPSESAADEVFLRRVFLDTLAVLPTPEEARRFLVDSRADKRGRLIDQLLERREFGEYLGLRWGDLLRVKSEFPSNLWPNAVQAYDRWIRESFRDNKPYDRFVRELLTASGSNFRSPPANFYRAFQERSAARIAENVALLFMGLRLEGPDGGGFTPEQKLGLAAFFAKIAYKNTDEWKEEIVYFNPAGVLLSPLTHLPVPPAIPGGRTLSLAPEVDPRVALADWLTSSDNPYFARCMANRVWFWLMGRGLVHEPDDMRPDNVPWSPALLSYLEKEFVAHRFDLKHLYRLILNSRTYQLASQSSRWNLDDIRGFSRYRMRRLDAEVLLDAMNQCLGTGEKYSSEIPEPFTFLPPDQRAVMLPDGSIELPFLELFGRPARNTSFESERTATPSVFQAQYLLNASHIQQKIEQSPVIRKLISGRKKEACGEVIMELYLRLMSRFPTADEKARATAYFNFPKRTVQEATTDLVWVLLNSKEYVLRH